MDLNPPKTRSLNRSRHHYLVIAQLIYMRDGEQKQRHMNTIVELEEKLITAEVLNSCKMAFLQRLVEEAQVPPQDVADLVFLGFSYLGNMPSKKFHGTQKKHH